MAHNNSISVSSSGSEDQKSAAGRTSLGGMAREKHVPVLCRRFPTATSLHISAFTPPHPQVVFGGELQEKGCTFELKVNNAEDLNRCTQTYRSWLSNTVRGNDLYRAPPRRYSFSLKTSTAILAHRWLRLRNVAGALVAGALYNRSIARSLQSCAPVVSLLAAAGR